MSETQSLTNMPFQIRPATRVGIKPLIGIFGESGTGKTHTALILARGLVGESGKIVMLDTESGRGSLYADVLPGGYDVIEMREPFSPRRYIEAICAAEEAKADVLVIDSASHEWEGIGGVTDMAGEVAEGRASKYNKEWDGEIRFGDWKTPKSDHQKFVLKLLQSPLSIIVCLRAKRKTHQVKGTQEMADRGLIESRNIGKSAIIKDEFSSPIQAEDFIFEMMAYMEIFKDHTIDVIKQSHPSLRDCFPENRKTPITIEHGQKLAAWCNAASKPPGATAGEVKALKKALWTLTQSKHLGDPEKLRQWLTDESLLDPATTLEDLTAPELIAITNKAKGKL